MCFFLCWKSLGDNWFSSTLSGACSIVWSLRSCFFYHSERRLSCFVVENTSLLPFQATTLLFGRIEHLSSTFQSAALLVSSQIKLLFFLSALFLYCLVVQNPSLLPFRALPHLFRRIEPFSSTFPRSISLVSSQRTPLFYLSARRVTCFVVENPSLLPFRAPPHLFRHIEPFSSTFPSFSSTVWSYRTRFFYLSELSLTCFVVEKPSLLPF